jgi:IS1 family transposase
MARILDLDPITDTWETYEYDENDDQVIVKRFQDVEPVLNLNKRMQSMPWSRAETMWHAASIPNIVVEKWLREHGVNVLRRDHWPAVRRLLNSNEYRYLRAREFHI